MLYNIAFSNYGEREEKVYKVFQYLIKIFKGLVNSEKTRNYLLKENWMYHIFIYFKY